ncbi:MAG: hypothetical protein IKO62_02760 [Bacteroidales bacterium]|nr:hypothetical protein [Bacteroidales bacterium]
MNKFQEQFLNDIDEISKSISVSEGKDSWLAHPAIQLLHCGEVALFEKAHPYFILPCRYFEDLIINERLLEVVKQNSNLFGTGMTIDVLRGLHNTLYANMPFEKFKESFSQEKFAYIGEYDEKGLKRDRILRLDFYRIDKENEFIGGLFHTFKHFNFQKLAVTTKKGEQSMSWIHHFMVALVKAFLCQDLENDPNIKTDYISKIRSGEHNLKFVFYLNKEANVYFLKTAYIED